MTQLAGIAQRLHKSSIRARRELPRERARVQVAVDQQRPMTGERDQVAEVGRDRGFSLLRGRRDYADNINLAGQARNIDRDLHVAQRLGETERMDDRQRSGTETVAAWAERLSAEPRQVIYALYLSGQCRAGPPSTSPRTLPRPLPATARHRLKFHAQTRRQSRSGPQTRPPTRDSNVRGELFRSGLMAVLIMRASLIGKLSFCVASAAYPGNYCRDCDRCRPRFRGRAT